MERLLEVFGKESLARLFQLNVSKGYGTIQSINAVRLYLEVRLNNRLLLLARLGKISLTSNVLALPRKIVVNRVGLIE